MMRTAIAMALLCNGLVAARPVMFRGGPDHLGIYESSAAPTLSQLKWKFKTGSRVLSSPAVHNGCVYVGSADHHAYAINAADGSLRWKFQTGGGVNSSPAVASNLVYFGSIDGNFYAVDAAAGKLQWKFQTGGERRFTAPGIHGIMPHTESMPDPFDVFLSSPVVAKGVVYFGSGDHNIYALDAKTGTLKWKFTTGDVVHASPAVADGVLYIGSWDRYFYALDALTGKVRWKFQTGDDTKIYNQIGIAGSAALSGGIVYFGCRDSQFYALDAATGAERWRHDNRGGWVIASPAVSGGAVYFPTSDGQLFHALDAKTGGAIFQVSNKAVSFSSPAIAGDFLYFGTSDGWLHGIDIRTGRVKYEFQTDGNKQNGTKYIGKDGKMNNTALSSDNTLDGTMIYLDRMYSLGSILSSPVIDGRVIYFGSTDGHVYAVA